VLFTRYHYDETRPKENFPIGDAVVKLDSLGLTDQPVDKQFKLTNPSDGQSEGEVTLCPCETLVGRLFTVSSHYVNYFAGDAAVPDAAAEGGTKDSGGVRVRVPALECLHQVGGARASRSVRIFKS